MTIIFDFNRTLYDPDTSTLVPGAFDICRTYFKKGYELHLVSYPESKRASLVQDLGIDQFFKTITFTEDKEKVIKKIIQESKGPVYVVGDHLHNEIRIGNRYGAKTVWLKRGRFENLKPEHVEDVPWRTITSLEEISAIIP